MLTRKVIANGIQLNIKFSKKNSDLKSLGGGRLKVSKNVCINFFEMFETSCFFFLALLSKTIRFSVLEQLIYF